ncbi:hypothetical protein [Streptomyces sp. NPDC048200]|uniref:hypothetical protein n=1 Tax=Streptomyces sp. NPDC048200 TaxID=3365512 RepID=UPI00371C66E3
MTDAQLAQAQDDIEIFTSRVYEDTPRIRTRDLYWLGRAVARQAAWLAGQFGLETRLDATQIQQDQVSSTLTGDGLVLAPMAARALRRVSWMRSRTVHIRSALEGSGPLVGNPLLDSADNSQPWVPYPGGA